MQLVLPRHLRPRRDKIFGPAPSHRLDGARVMQDESSQAPPEQTERPLALRREHGSAGGALLSNAERAAIVARMDAGTATKPDWDRWIHDLEIRLGNV